MTGSSVKARARSAATAPDSAGRANRMPYPANGTDGCLLMPSR
ncbi:hypothetical protein [Streptomyces yangpuensis]